MERVALDCTIYVSNVSYQAVEENLHDFLRFCGPIKHLRKLGMLGFTASHYVVEPKPPAVDMERVALDCTIYVSNVSYQAVEENLHDFLRFCGPIKHLRKLGMLGFTASHYVVEFETVCKDA
eukprot:TRINITY_DN198_c0_g1_i1.p1 TRINITY_DN198_c0_g1~~TRINITY_DN198_c0_g1_i1.p1  ORF type:complete len:137 (-),score=19.07 TRINITY_DN198_c0_g1_i1:37-402(-)